MARSPWTKMLGAAFAVCFYGSAHAAGGGGELVVVANQEPQSMQAQVTYKEINGVGLRNVIENLTRLDPATNEVLPMLALSWEQVEPTSWHFKLREGVKFHDGTDLDAEAAAVSINWLYSDENNFSIREMMGPQITAEAVDDMTLAINTESPDPLLPRRIYLAGLTSAKQILENPADHDVHPIGTGPYIFDEWKQGQYWTAKANPDWWGNDAEDTYGDIHFDSLRVIWRPEPAVRSAMVESGEAQVAMFLTKEECDRFNEASGVDCIVKGSDTFLSVRLDYHGAQPVLEDLRFREAVFTGIDWEGIRINLMGLGEPLAGQLLPSAATGFHDGISQYAYDPVKAKALIEELKGEGQDIPTIHIATRLGSTPRNGEMIEAMGAMLNGIGVPTTVAVEEPGVFNPWVTTKPDPARSGMWLHPQGNPLMDYAAQFSAHYLCGSIISVFCDPDFDARVAAAGALVGDERHQALRELVKEGHDRYIMGAVGLLQRAYGVPEGYEWDFGLDHRILAVNMKPKD
ncbi:ABC transporter substrate-binding protein [Hoeflea prorocentri]|uniref:ABC transporter substrate-binding protein n=1 Tax=Hoeflea prorocentri TaxID=1922333 RepID=A0A9X3ZJJ2_9HYPH|nr:ABC transporter substrate-binding protein [Hoeflea prorocentri]MCY6383041.1 ABC transporter substrate-binding protein [Hoeflea prorocentri]MDA5400841.1 ABC transporter substrate-binding protein [Hoeflea prorocentri]